MLDYLETAEEMYNYCKNNKFGTGSNKKWAIRHFQLLIDNLKPDEKIYCVFIGLHNYKSLSRHDDNFAYALTDKRILMAQHKLHSTSIESVNIENINDISMSKKGVGGMGIGTVCIDTIKETVIVGVNIAEAGNIYEKVHEAWDMVREQKANNQSVQINVQNEKSPAEQIKEFKELLDLGIITDEEFEAKNVCCII